MKRFFHQRLFLLLEALVIFAAPAFSQTASITGLISHPRGSNFTDTPAFNNPVRDIQAGNAGHITSAGAPRDIQFGLKLLFDSPEAASK